MIPISVLQSWPKPNVIDPAINASGRAAVIALPILAVLAVVIVALRIHARVVKLRNAGLDDWIMIAALVITLASTAYDVWALAAGGFEHHIWDLEIPHIVDMRKMQIVVQSLSALAATLIKISILLFLRRFTTNGVMRVYSVIIWFCIAFVSCWFVVYIAVLFTTCVPLHSFWDQINPAWAIPNAKSFHCINEGSFDQAMSVLSVVQDLIAAALPISMFWNLQLPIRQKIGLMTILGLGVFTCIAGTIRTYYTFEAYSGMYDLTWNGGLITIWTAVELLLGIICGSLPALKVFFQHNRHTPAEFTGESETSDRPIVQRRQLSSGTSLSFETFKNCGSWSDSTASPLEPRHGKALASYDLSPVDSSDMERDSGIVPISFTNTISADSNT